MNLLAHLLSFSNPLVGKGKTHTGQTVHGRLKIQSLVNGRAALLDYKLTTDGGEHFYSEAALLGLDKWERPCLWPVMVDFALTLAHEHLETEIYEHDWIVTFSTGSREDVHEFRQEIEICGTSEREIKLTHGWGMRGTSFRSQFSCNLREVVA